MNRILLTSAALLLALTACGKGGTDDSAACQRYAAENQSSLKSTADPLAKAAALAMGIRAQAVPHASPELASALNDWADGIERQADAFDRYRYATQMGLKPDFPTDLEVEAAHRLVVSLCETAGIQVS